MKHDLESLKVALASAPALHVKAELTRLVPFASLVNYDPPNWLYTSGKPNRYNPAGVNCVYFAETTEVAQAEYESMWKGVVGRNQPFTTFFAAVDLRRVLDLTDPETLKVLKVEASDLYTNWRGAKHPTLTQFIGQAVNETGLFSAIRYPFEGCSKQRQTRG